MILGVEVFGWKLFWALACGGVVGAVVNFVAQVATGPSEIRGVVL